MEDASPKQSTRPVRIPESLSLGRIDPLVMKAGEVGTWILTGRIDKEMRADSLKLVLGGHRWIKLDMFCQNEHPSSEGYVSGYLGSTRLEPVPRGAPQRPHDMMSVSFRVPDGILRPGTRFRFILGDRTDGSPGIAAPTFTCRNVFIALVAEPRPGGLHPHELNWVSAFVLDILGGPLDHLKVIAPSTVAADSEFSLLIRPQDKYGNISSEKPRRLVVESPSGRILCELKDPEPNLAGALEIQHLKLDLERETRLRVSAPMEGLTSESNPIIPSQNQKLLWGLIHEHTELSDGAGSIDLCYNNMRYGSGLDFGAVTDHDHRFETSDQMWRIAISAAARHNHEGQFVTLLGYEWAKWRRNGDGDRNVYYRSEDGPMLRSETGEYDRPGKLFEGLTGREALVIPHHTAYEGNFCDWTQHDPNKERLVEIYSVWGSSETSANNSNPFPVRNPREFDPRWLAVAGGKGRLGEESVGFVQNALEYGWRVGFTAGGDMHLSHPGDDYRKGYPPYAYKAGLTAVWTDDRTRASLWRSLFNRRCYATTGARIILRFDVNGHPMGSEATVEGNENRIARIEIHGTENLNSVEVVRNNQVVRRWQDLGKRDAQLEFVDTDRPSSVALPPSRFAHNPFLFYYLRIRQEDGEMAWSSPVWFDVISS